MISVSDAKKLVWKNTSHLDSISIDLYSATEFTLTEDIHSPIQSPPFNQSAVDGYAYCFNDSVNKLELIGEVPAGDSLKINFSPNSCVRIFTGAQVPDCYDTVVMQEKVERNNNEININDPDQKKGMNIRLAGSQIQKGELAVKKGKKINAAVAGYLAGLGIARVNIFKNPKVSIISTGNELISPGTQLQPGKIFESNTYSLNAVLNEIGIIPTSIVKVKDDQQLIENAIQKCLVESDIVILSGGVSVGDYDFVASALTNCKVECIFHKVKQKPGKPLYFGKKDKTLFFGLPGNPAALLTCYYEYILPCILKIRGEENKQKNLQLKLTNNYTKKPGLTHFVKGKIDGNEVTILNSQESYLMNSFAQANCLVQLDEEKINFEKSDIVEVHPI